MHGGAWQCAGVGRTLHNAPKVTHPGQPEGIQLGNVCRIQITQLYKPPAMVGGDAPPEVRAAVRRVQADYLQASLDVVERDFGGMDNYLGKGLGLSENDLKRLKYLYLTNN